MHGQQNITVIFVVYLTNKISKRHVKKNNTRYFFVWCPNFIFFFFVISIKISLLFTLHNSIKYWAVFSVYIALLAGLSDKREC